MSRLIRYIISNIEHKVFYCQFPVGGAVVGIGWNRSSNPSDILSRKQHWGRAFKFPFHAIESKELLSCMGLKWRIGYLVSICLRCHCIFLRITSKAPSCALIFWCKRINIYKPFSFLLFSRTRSISKLLMDYMHHF